jgi:hypothetical protein
VSDFPLGAAAFMLLGLAFAGYGAAKFADLRSRIRSARGWHSVTGRVYSSRVLAEESVDVGREPGQLTERAIVYRPEIRFEYVVGGREYASKQLRLGEEPQLSWPSVAEALVKRYPVGQEVTVYYDPSNPDQAVLERASGPAGGLYIGFGLLGLAIAIGALLWTLRS